MKGSARPGARGGKGGGIRLYLDVDGVFLGKADPQGHEVVLAAGAAEFLEFALLRFECFWLTTHCRHGEIEPLLNLFSRYADKAFIELARKIEPARWGTLKTEAIDLASDFFWLDDQLLYTELEVLKKNNALERHIHVDTRKNPADLFRVLDVLRNVRSGPGRSRR